MKSLIVLLWVLGFVFIAMAAAVNPYTPNPAASSQSAYLYKVVILFVALGLASLIGGATLFWIDVWETIR
jgi:hypothetical protein